jgi:hypothetical protein
MSFGVICWLRYLKIDLGFAFKDFFFIQKMILKVIMSGGYLGVRAQKRPFWPPEQSSARAQFAEHCAGNVSRGKMALNRKRGPSRLPVSLGRVA